MPMLDDFQRLDEVNIRTMAENGSENMRKLLSIADAWRACDLTPAFIMIPDPNDSEGDDDRGALVACVAEEKFGLWLN